MSLSSTSRIVIGLLSGIALGLFVGEFAAPLVTVGDIYIGLLQMTVLPYIVVSLMANLGAISWERSRRLILAAVAVLSCLLLVGVAVLLASPLAFPDWQTGSFFTASLIAEAPVFDLVNLYIPANPFAALANNVVPAAVLFSILLGIGLGTQPGNTGLLNGLKVVAGGLNQINSMVIKLTPFGVFAIGAGAAGTIEFEELSRLQAYLLTYTAVALVLSLLVLPLLVSAVTPFGYREILAVPRDTLITIFATGKIIVVLPQLIENVRELFRRHQLDNEQTESAAGILLPLAYPFPNLGTYTILMFVPFCAWFLGTELEFSEQLMFQLSALMSSFVAPIIGVPFLLDLLQIPADLLNLFVISTVYTDRIRVVLGAMHLLSLCLVAIAIARGVFALRWLALLRAGLISLFAFGITLVGVRSVLQVTLADSYHGDQQLVDMGWMYAPVEATLSMEELPQTQPQLAGLERMQRIAQRGTVRVGFLVDSLPFAYRNNAGEAVGFDIEMAHQLAADLEVGLELVRVEREQIATLLHAGQIDIVMSGLAVTPGRLRAWNFSRSVLDINLALLVADHRRNEFRDYNKLLQRDSLTLGAVQQDAAFIRYAHELFPNADIDLIKSPRRFLRGRAEALDAVVFSAEGGSAWTLIYPGYSVVVPQPLKTRLPLAYPMPQGEQRWHKYVSDWIELKQKDGTVDGLFRHWIQGGGASANEPRWSIMRDVLQWVE